MDEARFLELLFTTDAGRLLLIVMVFVTLNPVIQSVIALVRKPQQQHSGNGKSVEVVAQLASNQHEIIMGLIEQFSNINTALRAQTITLESLVQNDANRRTMHELNTVKIEQQSSNIDELKTQQEKLGSFLVNTINKGEGREAAFSAMIQSVQDAQGAVTSILQEIRNHVVTARNGSRTQARGDKPDTGSLPPTPPEKQG
jgi:hypothetical protein